MLFKLTGLMLLTIVMGCGSTRPLTSNKKVDQQVFGKTVTVSPAEVIYYNGDIITLEDDRKLIEALAVGGGKIVAVGPKEEVMLYKGSNTKMVDLKGKTMVPGFVDGHSYITEYVGLWGAPELSSPPDGNVRSISDIVLKIKKYISDYRIPAGQVVAAFGYDDSLLKEKRHPTAHDLDLISKTNPIFIVHASGHLAVGNTEMMKRVGFVKGAQDPVGGRIILAKNGVPTGLVEEQAVYKFTAKMKPLSLDESLRRLEQVQKYYASQGVTTAQDGLTQPGSVKLLEAAAKQNRLIIDVVSYPKWTDFSEVMSGESSDIPNFDGRARQKVGIYENRLKFGGIKITQDGSPQSKTAYLTKPYLNPPAGESADYRGIPALKQAELDRWIEAAYKNGIQVLVDCNGDAAADMMIESVRKAQDKYGDQNLRPVMIHAQMVREDQLDEMKQLGIAPSFFSAQTYYWGDWYVNEVLGRERAARISPLASALKREMIFANDTDSPAIPPNQMMTIDSAVNRTTRSGKILGPEQRISAREALKAVTINGAYLYGEENSKGSIKPGKMADLAMLSANPLKTNPSSLKYIEVLETIKEGKSIYQRTQALQINPTLTKEEKQKPETPL